MDVAGQCPGLESNLPSSGRRPGMARETASDGGRGPLAIAELTRRMVAGDEPAWRIFYDAYFDRLWRYLLVVTNGHEDVAREALQATLVRVARHIKVMPDETV